ncbi:MAG: DNA mismatch repair endonuclease MutL, partial [Lachnospiraceae bacterium]|nr:DNA mismatch repair endonuclease MutL [Lachnospiraceae bacterium]
MKEINVLDKLTIDKIAAGEVIERPLSIVKELMENSIDSGATMISVEIADGGISLIRVSDNGSGIDKTQIRKAFLRHSTSKISTAEDLSFIHSLGFRGEALSSICAVSKVELCTKTADSLTGIIYKIYGGEEISFDEAGLPNGTTVVVRDVFYNTPARLKFLKTPHTEGSYIADIVSKIALSHPEISIKFINNKSVKINTSGNGILKDAIYAVYGRDITSNLLEVQYSDQLLEISGFIGKPELARANRSFELMFVNGRYVKDRVISGAVEEAFKGYQMKGTFPFAILNLKIEPEFVDVNVHPAKSEIRFFDNEKIYNWVVNAISERIKQQENIPYFTVSNNPKEKQSSALKAEPIPVNESIQKKKE